jgi:ABC-type Fe3+ transport system substrate-binding protein
MPTLGNGSSSVIDEAKKEKKLVIYTTQALNIVTKFVNIFNEKYPFLEIDIYRSGGQKLLTKAVGEARAGKYIPDVFNVNFVNLHMLKDKNLLRKYVSPESRNYREDVKESQGFWTCPYMHSRVVAYNTRLVSKQEAPNSYEDLLDPKWKGNIGMPMQKYAWFGMQLMIRGEEEGLEFFKKLAAQELLFHRGLTLNATLLAAGEFSVLGLVSNNTIENLKDQGAPVEWIHARPTVNTLSGPAVAAKAPHPNAAKLYVDFLLSRKGQEVVQSLHYIPTRTDVKPDPPRMALKGKLYYYDPILYKKLDYYTKLYNSIFDR